MQKNNQFLEYYRQYESLLRSHGTDYKSIEDTAEDQLQNQMRITRQMRNFLSHTPDTTFLSISDKQIQWLRNLIREEEQRSDVLKKHLKLPKTAAVKEGEPILDVLLRMSKQESLVVPVYRDTTLLGTVSLYQLTKKVCKQLDAVCDRKTYGKWGTDLICYPPDTAMDIIFESQSQTFGLPICCTEDGTLTGKFLGVYQG